MEGKKEKKTPLLRIHTDSRTNAWSSNTKRRSMRAHKKQKMEGSRMEEEEEEEEEERKAKSSTLGLR